MPRVLVDPAYVDGQGDKVSVDLNADLAACPLLRAEEEIKREDCMSWSRRRSLAGSTPSSTSW
jgi:hypothetical protein